MTNRDTRDGFVVEEFVTATTHLYDAKDGSWLHDNDPGGGEYTGVFWFQFRTGKCTPRYTEKTAPKWLLNLWKEAIAPLVHYR